ncbi:Rnf-Nqr domain containing protein [Candidatus Similichlamydia epinepheli]|uniref:Rnf-Nqr domain containing protein n=1 Tax=Candidatus Similichlamydia epinepheli TaxID=1903953 RepID=UPI000D3A3E58|nr:Rnf-Nqr domain containing protein [Candidatus Similichlamydia epinepheli]
MSNQSHKTFFREKFLYRIKKFLFADHQIFVSHLGICSALGVTNKLENAWIMTLGLCFIASMSVGCVSLLRKHIPDSMRLVLQMVIICTFCLLTEQILKAFLYEKYKRLSIYINLIVTNCILLGRCESYAMYHPPLSSMWDGLRAGIQYGSTLLIVAFIRELFGNGSVLNHPILPETWYATITHPSRIQNIGALLHPAGAFFVLATVMMFANRDS